MDTAAPAILERIRSAIDAHDADGLAACFSEDYRNETPAHPDRSFTGREQVRSNWTTILRSLPDLRAELIRWGTSPLDPQAVWAEWDWAGRRADGAAVRLRGVTVLGV